MAYKIVAISGSLSKDSTNSGLIRSCILANNPDVQIQVLDISQFPLFNIDLIVENDYPASVQEVRKKVTQADGIIFATPEHNTKISAALKNAYDWVSFTNTKDPAPIKQKPAALIVSSPSGGIKPESHFKRVCEYCKVKLMKKSLLVTKNQKEFDENGNVLNMDIQGQVNAFVSNFVQHIKQSK